MLSHWLHIMSSTGASWSCIRTLEPEDDIAALTTLVNDAYRVGESGILVDTPEQPLFRVTQQELKEWAERKSLLILSMKDELVGCIQVKFLAQGVAEWGCLAVAEKCRGQGYGKMLVQAAEECIRVGLSNHENKSTCQGQVAQLQLLAPSSWKHKHKERLREWYHRMGYSLANGTFEESTKRFPKGSFLGLDRFQLATDGDLTCYQKVL